LKLAVLYLSGQATAEESENYKSIYVPKRTNYTLMVANSMPLTKTRCDYSEANVLILMKEAGNESPSRLAAIPQQELKTDFIIGVITSQTRETFQLGKVSLLCNVTSTGHDEFKLHLKLEIVIPGMTTNHPTFDEVYLEVRCLKGNDVTRHEAGHYRLVYYETRQGSALNSISFTQASQSLGLPATPSPDPGPSEKTENPPAGTPTNYSTVTPSLKSDPDAGKLEVGWIVGPVVVILVVLIAALFAYLYKKRATEGQALNNSANPAMTIPVMGNNGLGQKKQLCRECIL